MGGSGSTRWGAHRSAWTVEECAEIPIRYVVPALRGEAEPRGSRAWTLTRGLGTIARWDIAWAVLRREEGREAVVVAVRSTYRGTTREGQVTVGVLSTQPHYGGTRYWWMCPSCGRRVTTLYVPGGPTTPACRACYSLTYRSCQAHDKRQDRYRRMPPWERIRLLHQMTPPAPPELPPRDGLAGSKRHVQALSRMIAGMDERLALIQSMKGPRHSEAYYERRRDR